MCACDGLTVTPHDSVRSVPVLVETYCTTTKRKKKILQRLTHAGQLLDATCNSSLINQTTEPT